MLGTTALMSTSQAAPPEARAAALISTDWLANHLSDVDLILLHVGDEARFKTAHIPGARYLRQSDVSIDAAGRMLEMPTGPDLRKRLSALGIGDRSRIVVYYDEDWISPATRIMLTLRTAGLGARAGLLDGGLAKWRRENRAVTVKLPPATEPGALGPLRIKPTIVDAAFVRTHAGQKGYALIDARAPVFYRGIQAGGPPGHQQRGHIPHALSLPFTSIANDDLTIKTPGQLLALFRQAGVRPGDRAIVYCHI
ncbi:MAG: rhodanese-like domain-containing protein, partial [Sphingomonas sp.]